MTVTLQALWMLCALGATVLAAVSAARARDLGALAAGFVAAAIVAAAGRTPDAAAVGLLAALAAGIGLFRPRLSWVAAAIGGALAGTFGGMLIMLGLPAPASHPVAMLLLVLPIWRTRVSETFAPEQIREEALLGVAVLGLVVATVPGVLDGWSAAVNLAAATDRHLTTMVPAWTLALLLTSMTLGALYSVWSRR